MRSSLALALFLVVGCGDDDGPLSNADPGEQGGNCYPNGTCNATLVCNAGVCEAGGVGVDAPTDGSNCADDSATEPNDSPATAWVTPVDTTKNFPLASLALCPAFDVDIFSLMISTSGEDLELVVEYGTSAKPTASVTNSSGTPLAVAAVTTAGTVRAFASNLPAGLYYAQIEGGASVTTSYKMTLNVTGP